MRTIGVGRLRTEFHKMRKLLEQGHEVILTERGRPRYVVREHPADEHDAKLSRGSGR